MPALRHKVGGSQVHKEGSGSRKKKFTDHTHFVQNLPEQEAETK